MYFGNLSYPVLNYNEYCIFQLALYVLSKFSDMLNPMKLFRFEYRNQRIRVYLESSHK